MIESHPIIDRRSGAERPCQPGDIALLAPTGAELWRYQAPTAGLATPMTYVSGKSGRQFVVISAGGSGLLQSPTGDYVLAFALPKKK